MSEIRAVQRPARPGIDPQAPVLAALADNAQALTDTTGATRRELLLVRAELWEELAEHAHTPECADAYRHVAVVCREEACTLRPQSARPRESDPSNHNTSGEQ